MSGNSTSESVETQTTEPLILQKHPSSLNLPPLLFPTMPIPPGIRYLSHAFLLCIPISIFGYLVLSILIKYLDLGATTPQWRVILLALLTRPFYSFVLLFWNSYAISSDARRNGAQLVPQVRDPWPGGMSLVSAMVKSFKSGYPGWYLSTPCSQTKCKYFI